MKTDRCLSVRQPWAWLIVNGHKPIENRDWSTKVRGTIGVHAGQKFDRDGYEWVRREFPDIPMPEPEEFERGGIVGRADITDCIDGDTAVGALWRICPWFSGRYGFVLEAAQPLPFTPCRGMLGFFRPVLTPAEKAEVAS